MQYATEDTAACQLYQGLRQFTSVLEQILSWYQLVPKIQFALCTSHAAIPQINLKILHIKAAVWACTKFSHKASLQTRATYSALYLLHFPNL